MNARVSSALLAACLAGPAAAAAQTASSLALDYGPHDVGFTVIEALDSTRAFRPLRDYTGRLAAETAQPVQVSIWYPADAPPDAPRMRAGEFRMLRETEVDFGVVLGAAEEARLRADFIEAAVDFSRVRKVPSEFSGKP